MMAMGKRKQSFWWRTIRACPSNRSMGKPVPGFEVAIVDGETLQELPPGQEGDIAVRVNPIRPVGLFREYWKNQETANAFRGDWYLTGDRGRRDEEGYSGLLVGQMM